MKEKLSTFPNEILDLILPIKEAVRCSVL